MTSVLIGQRLFSTLENPSLLHLLGEISGVARLELQRGLQDCQFIKAARAVAKSHFVSLSRDDFALASHHLCAHSTLANISGVRPCVAMQCSAQGSGNADKRFQ